MSFIGIILFIGDDPLTTEKEKYYLWAIPIQEQWCTHMIIANDPVANEDYPIGMKSSCDVFRKMDELHGKGHKTKQVYYLPKNFMVQLEYRTVIHI